MSINSLEKRVAVIENRLKIKQLDPNEAAVLAFDCLNQNEIGLLEEYLNLSRSGFDGDAIEKMLGEATYSAALAVFRKLEKETARLMRGEPSGSDS